MKKKLRIFHIRIIVSLITIWFTAAQAIPQATGLQARSLAAYAQPTQTQLTRSTLYGDNLDYRRRALDDLFHSFASGVQTQVGAQNEHKPEATHTPNANELVSQHAGATGLFGHISTSASTATGLARETTSTRSESTTTTQGKYSVIGTLPPVPTPTGGNTIMTSWSSTPTYASAPTPTITPSSSKDQAIKQWKIIGVAVIAFSTVAAILLLAVFFDQWWRFVKDVFGRGERRSLGKGDEELVPDWEKASWEVRFGDDRHRYPSFSSFPSETGLKGRAQTVATAGNEGGWVRQQRSPSPLGQATTSQTETTEDSANAQGTENSSESAYHVSPKPHSQQLQQHSTSLPHLTSSYQAPSSPLPPTPPQALTRSKSQRSQVGPNPFDDPSPPRSPGMRSISARSIGGGSVYGGIA